MGLCFKLPLFLFAHPFVYGVKQIIQQMIVGAVNANCEHHFTLFCLHMTYLSSIVFVSTLPNQCDEAFASSKTHPHYVSMDEMSWQYSPMSEDSGDSRFCETPMNTCLSHSDRPAY